MATGILIFQFIGLAVCIALWVSGLIRRIRSGEMLPTQEQQVSPIGILDIGVTVAIWMALQTVAIAVVPLKMGIGFEELGNLQSMPADQLLEFTGWVMLSQLAATLLTIAYFLIRHPRVQWLELRNSFGNKLLVGIVGSLMLIPVVMAIQMFVTTRIPYEHPTIDSLMENFSLPTAIWAWIAAVGVAPLTEEFFFRGIIQGWLQRVFDYDEPKEVWFIGGPVIPKTARELNKETGDQKLLRFWIPIVITSILFAVMHMGQGPAPIPLFFLSLGLGYIFRKTGSFVPCVIIHLILNSLSMIVLTLTILFPELAPPQVEAAPAMFWIW